MQVMERVLYTSFKQAILFTVALLLLSAIIQNLEFFVWALMMTGVLFTLLTFLYIYIWKSKDKYYGDDDVDVEYPESVRAEGSFVSGDHRGIQNAGITEEELRSP
jgi:archaellum biogenesis protein FlaJ (TadC family)